MRTVVPPFVGALLTVFMAAGARTAPADVQLPPETVKLRPSKLPGFGIATAKCAICHSADYIAYQPPGMNQSQWTAEVSKMHSTYGAPIDADEMRLVGIYLTATYGDAKSIAPADMLPPAGVTETGRAASASAPTSAVDVQALLGANACLSCHAAKQKVVGPAYADVAAKYRTDPQAIAKIEASIRQGGVGRWGQVPMPPFAGLREPELKALAEFVMGQ